MIFIKKNGSRKKESTQEKILEAICNTLCCFARLSVSLKVYTKSFLITYFEIISKNIFFLGRFKQFFIIYFNIIVILFYYFKLNRFAFTDSISIL